MSEKKKERIQRLKAIQAIKNSPSHPLRGKRILREMPGATPGFGSRQSWPLPSLNVQRARHKISVKGSPDDERGKATPWVTGSKF
jgi:hypothetical protein